jgi:CRP-like cAMP-binding protein
MRITTSLLRQFDFFKPLSDADLIALTIEMDLIKIQERHLIIKAGAIPNNLIFLISGQLYATEFSDDARVIGVSVINPPSMLGVLTLIDGKPVNSNVVTLSSTEIITLSVNAAKKLIHTNSEISDYCLKSLAGKVRALNAERGILSQPNAFHRVFMQLNQFAVNQKNQSQGTLLPNQKEIASMVNTSRETVSRALQVLIKGGVLSKSGHQIIVQKRELLEKLAVDGMDALNIKKN